MSILYIRDKNGNFVQMPSVPGKSAYEIAVAKGTFSGTEQEFAEMQVINNKDIIDQITQENIDNWNSAKGMTDEEKEQLANKIDKVELTDDNELIFYSEDKEISRIQLQGGMSDEEKEQLNTKLATKFDDVALNENETNDMQTALDFYSEGKVVKTAYFTGGSGGGSSTSAYISTELEENVMVGTDENFNLTIDFVSPNPGKGTLKVFINDVEAVSKSVGQGESTTTIEGAKFTKGTNRVTVYVIDRVGVMSNSLTFYIRYGSTEISSDFDQYSAYDYGATVRYYFTPTALDTSLTLTFYMSIDGQVQQGVACTSDTRGYYTFPTNLSADNHYCEAYIIDSNGMKSNVLAFNLIILNTNTLVVASDTKNKTIEEGEQLSLDYKAYMKNNTSFITKAYIDNNLVNTGTCNADFNYYRTSSLTEGIHTIKLEVWDVTETYHDYVTWTITVTPSIYEMKQPVNAGAMFIGTAVNKTNTDERKQYFIGQDQEGNEVLGTLTNFAYNSESGWVNDELIISGNSHVEIPIQPLANNARYGFTLDIEFTSKQIGVADAEVLTLWNNETNCGIKITTEKLILQSSNGNKCDLYFTDNERTHVMFIIDRQELKAKIYLNGVMCEAFHLNDYTVDGVAYLDDFTVNSNIVLGGLNKNGYCKIRNLRVYQVALTTDEIINNFISCEIDKGRQRELVEFQKGNDLPTLYVYCDFSGLGKDDKKPCKIVYNSTNVEKYGESFTLNHKQSQLQYQGTSSMAYPIKNYRLNLRDEKGKKWYYNFPGGQGECRFTLKADFMSSGHWTNTGMAKFINDNLYNYKSDDEKSMNPFRWYRLQNGEDVSKYRETINGFPCRLILINDGSTPLNEGQNEPTPGNTKDMGIFNFNNDKDNVTTLGFNSDIFPNCASYEVTANSDTSAGAFMSFKHRYSLNGTTSNFNLQYATSCNLTISDITPLPWTIKSPSRAFGIMRVNNDTTSVIRVGKGETITITEFPWGTNDVAFRIWDSGSELLTFELNGCIYTLDRCDDGEYVMAITSQSDELAYLKESFELRHPDEDDVAEDWGFMGVGEDKLTIDYFIHSNTQISTVRFSSPSSTLTFGERNNIVTVTCYAEKDVWIGVGTWSGDTCTLLENTKWIKILFKNADIKSFTMNNQVYTLGSLEEDIVKEPYINSTLNKSYGLKVLIDWVDNCTDEEFVRDFEQHFHKDYTLRYFCLVTLIGAVDNLGKNMMLDTADNKIYFPRFYDIDTICSYDNSGQLKFDVDIEMEQGYWNTSSSRLWTRIRDLMHDDIVTTYNNMRQNGVSYENMMKYIYDEQIAKIPQTYYNKDYDVKYAPFADSYIGMAHGDTYEHVKRWLKQRFTFVDTLFDYAPSYNNDVLTIRANTTELMTLEIETYTPVYQHVSWYNGQMDKKKIDGKVSVEFSGTAQAATDQEVLIYGGSNVKSIKGITSMNPNRMLIGSATKLVEIDAHDCPLLADINANKANLSPHEYLNKVNLSNCPLLEGNLRLNNSPLVQEINIKGTNITGMNLPSSIRNLQVLRLPNTMTELTLNDASMLHTLDFDEGVNLQSISMTNCNALENVIGLDLLQTPSITLNNSYNTVAELYFRDTTNLSLSNMSNLERVIFTPNNEYETFELINVANAPDYKVITFNCPKLSTFMTTAPYRESYNNTSDIIINDLSVNYSVPFKIGGTGTNGDIFDTTTRCTSSYIDCRETGKVLNLSSSNDNIDIIVRLYDANFSHVQHTDSWGLTSVDVPSNIKYIRFTLKRKDDESLLVANDINNLIITFGGTDYNCVFNSDIDFNDINAGVAPPLKEYISDIQPNTTFTANSIDISNTQFTDVKLLCTTDTNTLKLPTTVKNFYCDSSFDLDTDYLEDGEYDVVHGELIEQYTTDYEDEVVKKINIRTTLGVLCTKAGYSVDTFTGLDKTESSRSVSDFVRVMPGTFISTTSTNLFADFVQYTADKQYITGGVWLNDIILEPNCHYVKFTMIGSDTESIVNYTVGITPNLIPSSADGSLIFSMYAPSNTVAPTSGTWDLKGLEFDNFHTFGMNNDVKLIYDIVYIATTTNLYKSNAYPGFGVGIFNLSSLTKPLKITTSDGSSVSFVGYLNAYTDVKGTIQSGGKIEWETIEFTFSNNVEWFEISDANSVYRYYIDSIPNGYGDYYNPCIPSIQDVILGNVKSLTMPARYDDYNISIKNANISPKTHNTMLYPLLVNEDNPIEGRLYYTNYNGEYLSWSFAYTKPGIMLYIVQPKDDLLNTYKYRYNAFYQTEYEFNNPYEVAKYTSNARGVLPTFNTEFTYTYDEIDNGDGTYTTKIYTDSLDNLPKSINFIAKPIISVDKLNTSQATNLQGLFQSCTKLERVDTRYWDTSKVTTMKQAFFSAQSLTSLDLSNLDTSNVKDMANMFNGCSNLTSLDVSNFDTSNVTDMSGMFQGCSKLTNLDVSGFDTANVTNMRYIFCHCNKLTDLDVSNFVTTNVTLMTEMFRNCSSLTSLDLSNFVTTNVIDMSYMFQNCSSLTSLDVSNFVTTNVTNMSIMFNGCSGLTSLDLSEFDTSKVITMANMFADCRGLTSLDVSGFDTSKVASMESMFYNCKSLTSLDVSGLETSNVTTMAAMFHSCTSLTSLDLSGFETSNVTNMNGMFRECKNLTSLDLSGFDTGKVATMNEMFNNCNSLTSLDLSGFDTSKVTNMGRMFSGCTSLTSLNVTNWLLDKVNTIIPQLSVSPSSSTLYGTVAIDESTLPSGWVYEFNDINAFLQFTANKNSTNLVTFNTDFTAYDVSVEDTGNSIYKYTYRYTGSDKPTYISFKTSSSSSIRSIVKLVLANASTMDSMFYGCSWLTSVDLSKVSISPSVTSMADMFYNCSRLTSLNLSGLNTDNVTNMSNMFYNCSNLTSLNLSVLNTGNVKDMSTMFYNCTKLASLNLSGLNTGNVTKMNNMFYGCNKLTSLDLSSFNTDKVTDMSAMFRNCSGLTSLDLSGFNTSKVTDMSHMFNSCSGLTSLDVSGFNTGKVTNMNNMFYSCKYLTSLDLSGFNTSVVTNMGNMFQYCTYLTSLDLSSFVTTKVTNMSGMFQGCSGLTSLNVSGFNTSIVTNMQGMFNSCSKLTSLDLSGFNTSKVTNMTSIFNNCGKLTELDTMQNISASLELSSTILDATSLLDVINNLATVTTTQTLTLGSTLLAKLTEEQIAIAVNKGWTVV